MRKVYLVSVIVIVLLVAKSVINVFNSAHVPNAILHACKSQQWISLGALAMVLDPGTDLFAAARPTGIPKTPVACASWVVAT